MHCWRTDGRGHFNCQSTASSEGVAVPHNEALILLDLFVWSLLMKCVLHILFVEQSSDMQYLYYANQTFE